LRQDNADSRLTPSGRAIGLVDDQRWATFQEKSETIKAEQKRLSTTRIHPSPEWDEALKDYDERIKQPITLEELLRRPRVPYAVVEKLVPASSDGTFAYWAEVETEIKYAGYIERQNNQVAQIEKLDAMRLPSNLSYLSLENLSKEAREKLERIRPETLGQATRIAGVSPADISVLLVVLSATRQRQESTSKEGIKEAGCQERVAALGS